MLSEGTMDKATQKPYLNLLIEWGVKYGYVPSSYNDSDSINKLIQMAYTYNAAGDKIKLGAVTAWLAYAYSINTPVKSIEHSKPLIEQALNHRDIHKLCCYVLDMFKTDCDCLSKVCQLVYNNIKYKKSL